MDMKELNDDNDPMLFGMTLPCGRVVIQYMEVLAAVQASVPDGGDPKPADIVKAIRETSRTPETAALASDAMLVAAWHRMTVAIEKSGNG